MHRSGREGASRPSKRRPRRSPRAARAQATPLQVRDDAGAGDPAAARAPMRARATQRQRVRRCERGRSCGRARANASAGGPTAESQPTPACDAPRQGSHHHLHTRHRDRARRLRRGDPTGRFRGKAPNDTGACGPARRHARARALRSSCGQAQPKRARPAHSPDDEGTSRTHGRTAPPR